MIKLERLVLSAIVLVSGIVGIILLGVWFGWKAVVVALLFMIAIKNDTRLAADEDRKRWF